MNRRRFSHRLLLIGLGAALGALILSPPRSGAAEALTIVAPAKPGGGWDQTARAMENVLQSTGLATPVTVENIAGAGGTVGLAQLADKYSGRGDVLMVSGLVMVGSILTNKSPVSLDQTAPIARLTGEYEVLAVPANSEIKSLGDEAKLQNPRRRVVLLAHSMGDFALAAGVQAWFLSRGATAIFDYAVLAAADEIDKSFELPAGARLSRLPDLAGGISVYYSLRDVAMFLSQAINLTERLGFDGPANKSSPTQYPPNRFRSINCTELNDYNSIVPPDSSHQYYRHSPKARDDITRAFTSQAVTPGESNLT